MSNEFLMEVFFIKIKVTSHFKNITENTEDVFETFAIKNKNKISYFANVTSYKLTILDNQIILLRDNEEFSHKFIFDIDKITKSEYYIKELNTSIDVLIKTTKLIKNNHQIQIDYEIIDSNNKYSYILDME